MKMTASVPQIPCQAMAQSSVDSINLKSLTFRTFIPRAARYGYLQKEIQIMIFDVAIIFCYIVISFHYLGDCYHIGMVMRYGLFCTWKDGFNFDLLNYFKSDFDFFSLNSGNYSLTFKKILKAIFSCSGPTKFEIMFENGTVIDKTKYNIVNIISANLNVTYWLFSYWTFYCHQSSIKLVWSTNDFAIVYVYVYVSVGIYM